ncbi:MAG TPA: hypothetical protein VIY52_21660 [Streptosporangiaceae bacterium]
MTVPMNPYGSVSTCRNAPSMFGLARLALASTHAAATLPTILAQAAITTGQPSICGEWTNLLTASTVTKPLTTSSVMLFPAADKISARFQPKVQALWEPEMGANVSRCPRTQRDPVRMFTQV